jgi:hypothetical protein
LYISRTSIVHWKHIWHTYLLENVKFMWIHSFIGSYFIHQHIFPCVKHVFNAWYSYVKCTNLWMDELHIFSSLIHHMLNLRCWSSYGPLAFFTRCLVCHAWSKRSFSSNVLIKSNSCLSCPRPLVKIIIPLGQCEYFNQVGPSKKLLFCSDSTGTLFDEQVVSMYPI